MSITRHTTTVPLKAMAMNELRDHIVEEIDTQDLEVRTDSLSDDECVLIITKNSLVKTVASLHRHRHRPMEIEVNVDHGEVKNTKDVLRTTKPTMSDRDNINYRWLWVLPIFGGLIIGLLNFMESFFASLFGSTTLSQNELIITVVVLSTILATSWIYGVPIIVRRYQLRLKQLDELVLQLIRDKINELDDALIQTDIIRCWSCFEALEPKTTVCSQCGETQK